MVREKKARRHGAGSTWDKPRIKAMLDQPVGSPVDLSKEEAIAIVLDSFGSMPYLPQGDEYVRQVRPIWAGLLKRRDG